MLQVSLQADSPVPLFHQISEALRYAIATGKVRQGDRLPPVRAAAAEWHVNMHTVRKAYKVLADEDLVSLDGARGTFITGEAYRLSEGSLDRFLEKTVREARKRFGLSAMALGRLVVDSVTPLPARPEVYVVECSEAQCETHSLEIAARWDVTAYPWCLEQEGEPPPGCVVATYFHYNEIRCRWPHRLTEIRFVTITPDPGLADHVKAGQRSGRKTTVLLCEFDAAQAAGARADVSVLLPQEQFEIETRIVERATEAVSGVANSVDSQGWDWILFTPRLWARLTPGARADKRVVPIDYAIQDADLESLGADRGWKPLSAARIHKQRGVS